MKLTKSKLKQLIKEELKRRLHESNVIKGPWDKPDPTDEWDSGMGLVRDLGWDDDDVEAEPTPDHKVTLKDAIHEFAAAYGTDDAEALKQELINIIDEALPDILRQY